METMRRPALGGGGGGGGQGMGAQTKGRPASAVTNQRGGIDRVNLLSRWKMLTLSKTHKTPREVIRGEEIWAGIADLSCRYFKSRNG